MIVIKDKTHQIKYISKKMTEPLIEKKKIANKKMISG